MKYVWSIILCFLLLTTPVHALGSKHAIAMSLTTREIVVDQDAQESGAPASLTKLMSGMVVAKLWTLEELQRLTTTIDAQTLQPLAGSGASVMGLQAGDVVSLYDLLCGLLMVSGADAALALEAYVKEHHAYETVALMNLFAGSFQMNQTYFTNVHGLDDPKQVSSAKDIALLLEQVAQDETLMQILQSKTQKVNVEGSQPRTLVLPNAIQSLNQGVNDYFVGGKTGFTFAAGYCLGSIVNIEGQPYAIVVMEADPYRASRLQSIQDTLTITKQLVAQNRVETVYFDAYAKVTTLPIANSTQEVVLIAKEKVYASTQEGQEWSWQYEGPTILDKPVSKNHSLAKLVAYSNGEITREFLLYPQQSLLEIPKKKSLFGW
ncbi:MAG: D-alanyl-D-alanine carboxypeptidase family protein [Erysipelotrichaceae bacterium]